MVLSAEVRFAFSATARCCYDPQVMERPKHPLFVPGLLVAAAAAVCAWDVTLAETLYRAETAHIRPVRNVLNNLEPFGHGVGVVAIALVVWRLDRQALVRVPAVLGAALGGGLLADLVKLFVGRTRPRDFDFASDSTVATFEGWLPELFGSGASHSFPSAHCATAAGLAYALSRFYPRGTAVFGALFVGVAGHRINSGAHYLSDVLVGTAVGHFGGWLACDSPLALAVRRRLERRGPAVVRHPDVERFTGVDTDAA